MNRFRSHVIALACTLVAFAACASVASASSNTETVKKAVAWMNNAGLSQWSSGIGFRSDAVSALAAARKAHVSVPSKTMARFIDNVEENALDYSGEAGPTAKLLLAAISAGKNPRCFGAAGERQDLVAVLEGTYNAKTGQYGESAFSHGFALAALKAAHEKVPAKAITYAKSKRGKYGWNYAMSKNSGDDVESTAIIIEGLRAAGVSRKDAALKSAYKWITNQRNTDGGYNPATPAAGAAAGETQANTTAFAIEAADAMGIDNKKAKRALRALQKKSGGKGAFRSSVSTEGEFPGISTSDPVIALSGSHYPVVARSRKGQSCA
jgi:hypothetical protein